LLCEAAAGEAEHKMDEEIDKADEEVEADKEHNSTAEADKEQGSTEAGHTKASCAESN
jgi:hypothetical protein